MENEKRDKIIAEKKKNIKLIVILVMIFVVLVLAGSYFWLVRPYQDQNRLTVGFIYDNESTTPYSLNFYLAQEAVQKKYEDKVQVMMYSNVLEENLGERMEELAKNGCDIIFTNGYGEIRTLAAEYPDIQFCQASNDPYPKSEARDNYHTFKGEVYQGRYLSGVVAGLKLKEMIENKEITPKQAKVGFVAAFPYTEVISGYTAFLLGVRSVVPQATMRVRYTGSWDNFTQEKARANQLLNEGCRVISQHTDTVGPAIACEEYLDHSVYHVGYNLDMTDVAPNTSLVSTRINWEPYIMGAVEAMLNGEKIEEAVDGRVHPLNDMSAGLEKNWVDLLEMNQEILPEGAEAKVDQAAKDLMAGKIEVFKGNYIGVNPNDSNDTINLVNGFVENKDSSIPSFHYILEDVITEE